MALPLVLILAASLLAAQHQRIDFFEKQVRPVLATQCCACHGPKPKIARGGLRQEQLHPNPLADPTTLLRRVHIDLTGLPQSRETMLAFLASPALDAASNAQITATRNNAVIPTQDLYLMNSPWGQEQAQQLAKLLPGDLAFLTRQPARWLIETICSRPARERELDRILDFITETELSLKNSPQASTQARTLLIRSLFISNEFLFRS